MQVTVSSERIKLIFLFWFILTDYTVHFMPADERVRASEGDNLLQLALEAGLHINASCGGDGACGKCRVLITSGSVACRDSEKLTSDDYGQGWRLACRSSVQGDVTVEVPRQSSLQAKVRDERIHSHAARHAEGSAIHVSMLDPFVRQYTVTLGKPDSADNSSDFSRLQRQLRKEHDVETEAMELDALQDLPQALRSRDGQVTASLVHGRIIRIEPGSTAAHFAVAFDIGTTSVWGELIDVQTGLVLAKSSAYNPQISCGDDVISRIIYSLKPGGLERLQQILVECLSLLIDDLALKSGIDVKNISQITAAGNTVMSHLLLGITPKYLREAPYVPVVASIPPMRAREIGLPVAGAVPLILLPCVASYVGGDIVAGVVASGMHETEKLTLYMDLGTNGEIVLGNRDWLMTASCSAGPAFEGGGLTCGMRAMPGAIEGFNLSADFEPMIVTIERKPPLGICGSGAINILAEFMEMGILSRNGKFDPRLAASRIREGAGGCEYQLVESAFSGTGSDIVITEADIDNIMRAKAAMFAGCHALLENASLAFSDIEQIIIAGAFGDYVDLENAIAIGLFPDIPRERYTFFGNGSLHGARLAACSQKHREIAELTARRMTNIELSEDRSFMDKYIAGIFLPHTDINLFPTVAARMADGKAGS